LFVGSIIIVFPYWKRFGQVGFSGWLSIGMVIPLINIVLLYYVALAGWPRDRANSAQPTTLK